MRIDWPGLLDQHRVRYVTSGPNVGRDEIAVRCPFCGDADPSEHMGISLRGRGWSCLRSRDEHSGRDPVRLLRALLGCSHEEARRIAGYDDEYVAASDELHQVLGRLEVHDARPDPGPLTTPREFKPLLAGGVLSRPFVEYVRGRGYDGPALEWVATEYDLRYATSGAFANRLIIPVRDRRGALLTWQGRAIGQRAEPRYLTLSTDTGRAYCGQTARVSASRALLGLETLYSARGAAALVVCEGAFDALRLTCFGRHLGVYATCLFGLNASDEQVDELETLVGSRFPACYLCIDSGEELRRLELLTKMSSLGARALSLPPGVEDPGDLSPGQVFDLLAPLVS